MSKALIVWGGWQGHEPRQVAEIFAHQLRERGVEVELADTLDAFRDAERLKTFDLVVPEWTMGTIEPPERDGLLEAVRSGVGVAGVHGGMGDSFRNETEYQFMVGGQWVAHPGGVIRYRVDIADSDHEITRGIDGFEIESEQYYMHVDPSNHMLATTTFSGAHGGVDWIAGCVMPVAWTRRYGAGRVFYCSLGHVARDFDVPEALELVTRGLLWAMR